MGSMRGTTRTAHGGGAAVIVVAAAAVLVVVLGGVLMARPGGSAAPSDARAQPTAASSPVPNGPVFVVPAVPLPVAEVKNTLARAEAMGILVETRQEYRPDHRRGDVVEFAPGPGTALRPGESLVATVAGPPPAPPPKTTVKLWYGSHGEFLTYAEVERNPTITVSVGDRLWVTGEGVDGRRVSLAPQDTVVRATYENGTSSGLVAQRPGTTVVPVHTPMCAPPPPGYDGDPCFGGVDLIGDLTVVVRK
jgi:hypothetical protein